MICRPSLKHLAAWLLTGTLALAQDGAQAPVAPPQVDGPLQMPGLIWDDALGVVSSPWRASSEDWTRFALGSAAVLATGLILDRPVQKGIARNSSRAMVKFSEKLSAIGNPDGIVAAGGFYLYGLLAKDGEARATGADAIASLAVASLVTLPLKYAVGRSRPELDLGPSSYKPFKGEGSFPSGHTTLAFTVAASVTEHYSEPWVQYTAYGLATLTGLGRLGENAHWTSDVVAGALIGTAVGKTVTRMNQRRRFGRQARLRWTLEPEIGLGYQGMKLGLVF